MIKVFDKTEQKFVTNGLRVLHETLSCYTTVELNGAYEVELTHPIDTQGKWKSLIDQNIIQVDDQLFRIYNVTKKDLTSVTVNARHIFYDLLDNLVEDIDIRGLSGAAALEKVMSNLAYVTGFTWMSDITKTNSIYLDDESGDIEGKNPIDAIFFLLNTYGGELVRDNFNIKMVQSMGVSSGVLIAYGKNIKGIEITDNSDEVITRIKPIGQDGLYLPELYVDSPNVSHYSHPKIKRIEFSDCNDYDSLRQAAKDYFASSKCDILQVNYKIDFVELSKTEEYKNYSIFETLNLGDTVTVRATKYGINVQCKIIKIKKNNLTERIEEVEFGNFKKTLADSVNKASQVADVFGQAIVNNKLTKSFLQSWVDNATDLIIKSNGGHVVQDENGISIMDTKDKATAQKVWRWNLGGLGYSSKGYNGPYGTAITADGKIVADYVTAGELNGAILKAGTVKTSALELNAQQEIEKGKFSYDQLSVLGVGLDNKVSLGEVVLVPKETKLQVSRAGQAINPLNAYNFTGGTTVPNNTLVTVQSGSNDYNYSANLEIFGDSQVSFSNPSDRIVNAESEIKQSADNISLVVANGAIKGADVVSAINVSGAKISMSALNIDLSGYVTFNSLQTAGKTTINGSNITTGVINADLIKAGTISGDRIFGGTISGSLLRTSNSLNYLMLHEQYIDFYNAGTSLMEIGYLSNFPLISMGQLGTNASFTMLYSMGSNPHLDMSGSIYFNGGSIDFQDTVDFRYNPTVGGYSLATQNWVANQSYATQSWVTTQNTSTVNYILNYIENNYVHK